MRNLLMPLVQQNRQNKRQIATNVTRITLLLLVLSKHQSSSFNTTLKTPKPYLKLDIQELASVHKHSNEIAQCTSF